jgi:pepF/M3 family oligoendopeptidase
MTAASRQDLEQGMTQPDPLPRWNLTTIFPSLESAEFTAAFEEAKRQVEALVPLFDGHQVRHRETDGVGDEEVRAFEEVTRRLNAVLQSLQTLRSYIGAFVATDATNETAQALLSELQMRRVTLDQMEARYIAWIGSLAIEPLLAASEVAREHEYMLWKAQRLARRQMAEGEEELAADLRSSGLEGWARLHHNLTALLTVPVAIRGETQVLPMSSVRALANDPDREVRRSAFEAELAAWEMVAIPLAAALNGIKGYQQALRRRRGYADDVEPTLLDNNIDRETLEAMQTACIEAFPDFRRYLRAKARALGLERLAWYDLNAPVGQESRSYVWPDAEAFIRTQFGRYSERMAAFAERSFREGWIDAEPRPGKEGGAFCTSVRPGESRVLMNYDFSFNSVGTLAHELGHAYHNLNLAERTPLQSDTPSTLAEMASIFCETLSFEAALAEAPGAERLALLEASLQRDLLVVVDIHSRFLFEKAVFERRARRELTPRELDELMLSAQRDTYGDGLDGDCLHPKMWAVKGHYYGPTFYNYPYTFGLLFGLGLYSHYVKDPERFRVGYDALLSSTGLADAATLAGRFGINIHGLSFWRSSLDVIRARIGEFEGMV